MPLSYTQHTGLQAHQPAPILPCNAVWQCHEANSNTQSIWPYFLAAFNHTKWLKRYSQEPLITLIRIDTCLLLTLKMALSKGCYLLMTIYDAIAQPLYHIIMYCISIPNCKNKKGTH